MKYLRDTYLHCTCTVLVPCGYAYVTNPCGGRRKNVHVNFCLRASTGLMRVGKTCVSRAPCAPSRTVLPEFSEFSLVDAPYLDVTAGCKRALTCSLNYA